MGDYRVKFADMYWVSPVSIEYFPFLKEIKSESTWCFWLGEDSSVSNAGI